MQLGSGALREEGRESLGEKHCFRHLARLKDKVEMWPLAYA